MRIKLTVLAILLCASAAFAHPLYVTCPIDGNPMTFDHSVGYGADAVCWYSHMGYDPRTSYTSKHEAYVACGD